MLPWSGQRRQTSKPRRTVVRASRNSLIHNLILRMIELRLLQRLHRIWKLVERVTENCHLGFRHLAHSRVWGSSTNGAAPPMKHSEICSAERCGFIWLSPALREPIAVPEIGAFSQFLPSFPSRRQFRGDPCPPQSGVGKRFVAAPRVVPLHSKLHALVLWPVRPPPARLGGPAAIHEDLVVPAPGVMLALKICRRLLLKGLRTRLMAICISQVARLDSPRNWSRAR